VRPKQLAVTALRQLSARKVGAVIDWEPVLPGVGPRGKYPDILEEPWWAKAARNVQKEGREMLDRL
jgi:cobalamin-dependent methionine synthase I